MRQNSGNGFGSGTVSELLLIPIVFSGALVLDERPDFYGTKSNLMSDQNYHSEIPCE